MRSVPRSAVIGCLLAVLCVIVVPPAQARNINGDSGPDILFGTSKADRIDGGFGADSIFGRRGDDTVLGGTNDDALFGSKGADLIKADGDSDLIFDDDGVNGTERPDVLMGMSGDDWIFSADGEKDTISCGNGIDAVFADKGDRVDANCNDDLANEDGEKARGIAMVVGTKGEDVLFVKTHDEALFGKDGDDILNASTATATFANFLSGGKGKDALNGSPSKDNLIDDDGKGGDELHGGAGPDTIYSADGASDTIDCGVDLDTDTVYADATDAIDANCALDDVHQPPV